MREDEGEGVSPQRSCKGLHMKNSVGSIVSRRRHQAGIPGRGLKGWPALSSWLEEACNRFNLTKRLILLGQCLLSAHPSDPTLDGPWETGLCG